MTNLQCLQCGFMDAVASEFCRQCGAELAPTPIASVSYNLPVQLNELHPEPDPYGQTLIQPFDGISAVLSPTLSLFSKNIVLIAKIVFVVFAPYEILKATAIVPGSRTLSE